MRIAHVSDCYLPRTGGIETQVRALALAQREVGQDVRIITATPGHDEVRSGRDVVDGIEVHRVAARLPFELPVHPRTRSEVVKVLTAYPVDVLHVHAGVISPFAWGAIRAAEQLQIPALVTVHSVWGPMARPGFKIAHALARWNHVAMSSVSEAAAERVSSALGVEVMVTPNGIDPAQWRIAPARPVPGALRLVSVMRLAPRKRLGALLHILKQASAQLAPEIELRATIIGDGPELARALSYLARNDLEHAVTMAGRLDRDAIKGVFSESDVFVQPSIRESFGLAALEARTAGLPVIVRDETGSTEFVTDRLTGLIVDSDAAMVGGIVELARDVPLRSSIAEHNRSVPPAQSWPNVLAAVDAAYTRAATT